MHSSVSRQKKWAKCTKSCRETDKIGVLSVSWQRYGRGVAEVWKRCGRDVRDVRDVRGVAEMRQRCGSGEWGVGTKRAEQPVG